MSSTRQVSDYEPVRPHARRAPAGWDADESPDAPRPPRDPEADSARALSNSGKTGEEASAPGGHSDSVRPCPRASRRAIDLAAERWSRARGHAATYAGLFLFTAVLYFRPYEYLPVPMTLAFWLAVVTLAVFIPSQFIAEGTPTARPREVNLVLLFALLAAASIPFATNHADALDAFSDPFIKAVLIFVVFVNAVRTEWRWKGMAWIVIGVSCLLSAQALEDYAAGRLTVEGYRVAGSIGGMFANPNDMAMHLVTIAPVAVGLMFSTRGPVRKLVYGASAVLMIAGSVVTFSRGAFLGLLGALAVLGWKLGRRHRVIVGLALVLGAAAFVMFAPGGYGARIFSIFDSSLDLAGSSSSRQALFWRSLFIAARHPLLGVGIGNFHIYSIHEHVSHNAYTQVAAEMGLTATVVYVLFMIAPLRRLLQIERETFAARHASKFYYRAVGLEAALVAYMISSFFASVAYQWYVYYLVGFAVTLRRLYVAQLSDETAAAATTDANAPRLAAAEDEAGAPKLDSEAEAFAR